MENSLYESARKLANKILNSKEYVNFQKCRERVEEDPELTRQVDEFRREAFVLQCQGDEAYRSGISEVRDRHPIVMGTQIAREYLDAEIDLCRMVRDVQEILVENIDIKVDFL